MLANKDPAAILGPLGATLGPRLASMQVVPIPGHDWHSAEAFRPLTALPVSAAADLPTALAATAHPVLIAGSLYLAGEALRLNDELPD